ncbi:ATP-binding protein [Hungatella hathewayi]|uniref:Predicted ATPase (AAA+ superfamily) n=1 Tax=Hungatella hathewayi TaxID=154046 RepID=A0A174BQF6_9FIRM|nr:ATP-binding protein [Hungatella hathewayi]CUO02857.1 Predicted ATPase (AAA+ superfamily) [Hungatella hathewayi]
MEIKRDLYLNKLIRKKNNGLIKIVTGVRRCGKSYLLFNLFHNHLLEEGVDEDHIIEVALDDRSNKELRNPDNMLKFVKERIVDKETYCIILDEVQLLDEFEDVLNSFLHIRNADIYVTGSNSKFLSSDLITEFRGRGDEIRIYTLSFREFVSVYDGSLDEAWDEYFNYGGLPLILSMETVEDKIEYLTSLFQKVYLSDIVERNKVRNKDELDELVDILASAIGSLTNPSKLAKTFRSVKGKAISDKTLKTYIDYLIDAFLISKAKRFDIKGKRYIGSPAKYYFEDIGLRNARLNFRQVEITHIMENIIYNELRIRGYKVDVGLVEHYSTNKDGKRQKKQLEVDFVATKGSEKYYIQSAFAMNNEEKIAQEQRPLVNISDSFKKIIIVADNIKVRRNEEGITTMGLRNFLLDENSLNV